MGLIKRSLSRYRRFISARLAIIVIQVGVGKRFGSEVHCTECEGIWRKKKT